MRELLRSKKFRVAVLAVLSGLAVKFGIPEVEVAEIMAIISPFLIYIGAQGVADIGKSAVQAEKE